MGLAYLPIGKPRSGKTTALQPIVDGIGASRCGGFSTEEMRVLDGRSGFTLVTLDSLIA